ncbi:hypothetical protein BDW59DRAFT_102756 [Aspergillus cavernicola]|uniref:Ubiquitin-like domain-containing protein n=1 Tax=Aspergillus cavernicola TaxID=176166 RepID=A0ABR4I3J4_9EURO
MSLSGTEDGSSPGSLVLHVLCPSLPSPNRFTFNDLPLSATIADLKIHLSTSIPSRPSSGSQRLFYLGKLLSDDNVTLQSLFEPLDGSEFSIHLVLPPSPPPSVSSSKSTPHHDNTLRDNPTVNTRLQAPRLRSRVPNPLNTGEMAQALQENARRRLVELQQRNGVLYQPRDQEATSTSIWSSPQQLPRPPSFRQWPSGTGTPITPSSATPPNMSILDSGDGFSLPEEIRPRLRLLKQYISLAEEQLNCGIAPTMDHIIQLRTHLFKLLDDQLRQPVSERSEYIEPLITRVFDISTRADLLRQPRLLTMHTTSSGTLAPLYLLSSPSGCQSVLASSATADAIRALNTAQISQSPTVGAQANAQLNANAAVMENVVRQAVLNQRPVAEGHLGLGRNLRRLWLFARLYFFCHMFSAPGSQTRIVYIVLAVIAAILSETSVPRRMYEMVLAPVQRHLEGLVHFAPEEHAPPHPQGAGATRNEAVVNQQTGMQNGREANWAARLHQNLRRVERSAALFIASLVPGVGERHIEVRNAAEAARNTELARQEEERRRQEEAAAAQENPTQADDAVSDSTLNATEPENSNAPQPMIPQEVAH